MSSSEVEATDSATLVFPAQSLRIGSSASFPHTAVMDRLWAPWRYAYASGQRSGQRKGIPEELEAYPEDHGSVFLNLIGSVRWAAETHHCSRVRAERAGGVLLQGETQWVVLNHYPYSSGHVMILPYERVSSLAALSAESAAEMIHLAQKMESALREVYRPDGINMGINLGEAAGAGIAEHLHMHVLPRWYGDTNFMTTVGDTRILPEALDDSWRRLRIALGQPVE